MSNTYLYKVTDMQLDAAGIVVACSFQITASDGVYSFTHNYHTAFNTPPINFTPYDQLTEADVIAWIKTLVQTSSEEQADAELAAFKQRKQITSGTPW